MKTLSSQSFWPAELLGISTFIIFILSKYMSKPYWKLDIGQMFIMSLCDLRLACA